MDTPSHPFRRWMLREDLSYEAVVEKLRAAGRETSAAYLRQIICGNRRPSFDFARDLVRVSGGFVTETELQAFIDTAPAGGEAA